VDETSDDVTLVRSARELDALRERTAALAAQLEERLAEGLGGVRTAVRRVRGLFDLRARIGASRWAMAAVALGVVGMASLGAILIRRTRARDRGLLRRAASYRLLLAHPERVVHNQPSLGSRLVRAALASLVSTVASRAAILILPERIGDRSS
jgi:hypothetical protein